MEDATGDRAGHFEANREHWEELVGECPVRESVDAVEEFLAGDSALFTVQREEVGSVGGKTLLDLQSHIGTRTLSWARAGATVTGVDISAESVALSREL